MLKYIYFGTPEISKLVLEKLVSNYAKPALIITSKDAPAGRKMLLTPTPVKKYAEENGIDFLTPEKLKDIEQNIKEAQADVGILFAYGKIIPQWLLDVFPMGIINVHPSLLPLYRGASPLTGPILNGDAKTGITIMAMDKDLDHGAIYIQQEKNIEKDTNRIDLENYVVENSHKLLIQTLNDLETSTAKKQEQDHNKATFTSKIKKEDGELKDNDTDETKYRKYRAYIGWPGTYFFQNGKRIKITKAHMDNGTFVIDNVIPENGKEISYNDFLSNNSF